MRMKTRELDDLVLRLQAVRDEDLASESGTPAAEALFERIVAEAGGDEGGAAVGRRRRTRSRRRWLVHGAAAAAVAVAVVVAIGGGRTDGTVTPAAAALWQAAAAARAQDGIPPGRYLYVGSVNATLALGAVPAGSTDPEEGFLDCCEALVPQVRELWLGDEGGDARLRQRVSAPPRFLSAEERQRWVRLGRPELLAKTPFSGIPAGIPARAWYDGPLDLPDDSDAVYEQFEQAAEAAAESQPGVPLSISGAMFHHVSDVLREARATPEQRAAAYEALARVPGVILLGEVTDRAHRRGVAVAMDMLQDELHFYRHVLVFDPETAELLEEQWEILPGNRLRALPAGFVEAYATYEYAVVGALGDRPGRRR